MKHRNTIITRDEPIVLECNIKKLPVLKEIDFKESAKLILRENRLNKKCSVTKFFIVGITDSRFLGDANAVHFDNQLAAITYRILKKTKFQMDNRVYKELKQFSKSWINKLKLKTGKILPYSFKDWINHFPPAKQRKYSQHENKDFDPELAGRYTMFVKLELIPKYDTLDGEIKAPRAISEAEPKVVASTGPYIYAISKRIAQVYNNSYKICYCSGMNAFQVGDWLKHALTVLCSKYGIEDPIFVENDFSQFDTSVNEKFCGFEVEIFKKLCEFEQSGPDKTCHEYLKAQVKTKGQTKDGTITYHVLGTRKSGDNNTSIGNSLINLSMQLFAYKNIKTLIIVLGDDSLTIMDKKYLNTQESIKIFNNLGFDAKVKCSKKLAQVEFCSSVFIPLANGSYVLLPKFGRFLSKHGCSFSIVAKNNPEGFMKEIATAYRHLIGIPLYGDLIKYYLDRTASAKATNVLTDEIKYKIGLPNEEVIIDIQKYKQFIYDRYELQMEEAQEELKNTLNRTGQGVSHTLTFGKLIERIIRIDVGLPSSSY